MKKSFQSVPPRQRNIRFCVTISLLFAIFAACIWVVIAGQWIRIVNQQLQGGELGNQKGNGEGEVHVSIQSVPHFDVRKRPLPPFRDFGRICVGQSLIVLVVANELEKEKYKVWDLPSKFTDNNLTGVFFWHDDTHVYSRWNDSLIQSIPKELPNLPTFLKGKYLLLDVGLGALQFGHTMTVLIQLILLLESGYQISGILNFLWRKNSHPRYNSATVDELMSKVNDSFSHLSNNQSFVLQGDQLYDNSGQVKCYESVSMNIYKERFFDTLQDAFFFQAFIRKHYSFEPTIFSCPPPVAVVLQRSGLGFGRRMITNYDAVERALKKNGISSYTNVTVSQTTSLQDAIKLFGSFGLIISTHSSQLNYLAFSHPGTIVVETRPKEMVNCFGHSLLSEGPDVFGIHYYSHNAHTAEPCLYSPEMCAISKKQGNKFADLLIDESALSAIIKEGLHKQSLRCKLEWK